MSEPAENIVTFFRHGDAPLRILTVEDNRIERAFLDEQITRIGHKAIEAGDGEEALRILEAHKGEIDVILMDRMMPRMDGMTAVRRIKEVPEYRRIPIVMVTAADEKKDIQEGMSAGIFYYLTKPVDEEMLRSILMAAAREAQQRRVLSHELKKHQASFYLMETGKFRFRTIEDADCLAAFLAHCFPDPDRVLPGLAGLMANAVEHGNLDLGYEQKTKHLANGTWEAEVRRRLSIEPYAGLAAEAVIARKEEGIYAIITDAGNGFPWRRYLTIDPARAGDSHGRGIAQANALSFDRLTYNEKGNQAVAFVGRERDLEW